MKTILHKSTTRGHGHHGWLDSWHTFSFGSYFNADRVNFGVLRALNDNTIGPGAGIGPHPHDNMEIISIPLEGCLLHEDSTGTRCLLRAGDVQAMSAGTGIYHSVRNGDSLALVEFLQIWVAPKLRNVAPRYDQRSFRPEDRHNTLLTIVSPMGEKEGVNIYQEAWFSTTKADKGTALSYTLKDPANCIYAFVLEGDATINGIALNRRDGLGLSETGRLDILADTDTGLLLMEVPPDPAVGS